MIGCMSDAVDGRWRMAFQHPGLASWIHALHAANGNFMRLILNASSMPAFFLIDDCQGGMI
jgi:hypothetical protein